MKSNWIVQKSAITITNTSNSMSLRYSALTLPAEGEAVWACIVGIFAGQFLAVSYCRNGRIELEML